MRRTAAFNEAVIAGMGDGLYTVDARGRVTFMNSAAEKMFGWTLEELRGERMHEATHHHYPDGRPFPVEECAGFQVLRLGRVLTGHEDSFIRKDGTFFDVVYSSSPIREAGEITGLIVAFRDVTERKQAELSKARLAAIIESSDDAIIAKDLNGVITDWNKGAERLFGYAAEEAVGRPVTMLIPQDRLDEEPGILARLRRGERIDHYETVRRRKDGTHLDVSLTVSPIVDAQGRVIGASKIARDITERKHSLSLLAGHLEQSREMQKKLTLLVEACHSLMAQTDSKAMLPVVLDYARRVLTADAYAVWRYDYHEERWRIVSSDGISAWAVEELAARLPYMPPSKSILGKDPLLAEDVEKTPWLASVRHIHGKEGNKSLLVAPLKIHGEYAGTIVFYYRKRQTFDPNRVKVAGALGDLAASAITSTEVYEREQGARREAERTLVELRRAEAKIMSLNGELEEKVADRTRELEAFCHSISHDLRTPLRSITSFSQILHDALRGKLDPAAAAQFKRIEDAGKKMAALIDNLLSLSRITRQEMRREPVDLSALARSVFDELQGLHPERRVDFRAAPGLAADGDPELLRLVLQNLLENAWKFTGKTERPEIEFGQTEVDGRRAFFVRDNGAGFDMAYADKLFGVFQRLHKERDFPGTGVGLVTVQRIVQRHGGTVWPQAQVGRGATFYLTLPPRAPMAAAPLS